MLSCLFVYTDLVFLKLLFSIMFCTGPSQLITRVVNGDQMVWNLSVPLSTINLLKDLEEFLTTNIFIPKEFVSRVEIIPITCADGSKDIPILRFTTYQHDLWMTQSVHVGDWMNVCLHLQRLWSSDMCWGLKLGVNNFNSASVDSQLAFQQADKHHSAVTRTSSAALPVLRSRKAGCVNSKKLKERPSHVRVKYLSVRHRKSSAVFCQLAVA